MSIRSYVIDKEVFMETCSVNCVHDTATKKAISLMPSDDTIDSLSQMFKLLCDPTRLKIVLALITSELCVCDISAVVGISQSAASHQLRVLRQQRLAKFRKDGKQIFYTIDDAHVENVIKMAIEHINHN